MPIALRERPLPGTVKLWTSVRSPARVKARRAMRCADRSRTLAAGRGPRWAMRTAVR